MAPALIGMIGRRRTGKDTFAKTLVDELGFQRVAFADPLREAALALNPIVSHFDADNSCGDPDCCGGGYPIIVEKRLADVIAALGWERAKDEHPEVRVILQRLGTDAIRALDDEFWVRAAMRRIEEFQTETTHSSWSGRPISTSGGHPVVVTDVRFPNEAEAIRRAGGTLIRVVRPGAVEESDEDLHPSETALDDFPEDFVVENTGTLEELAHEATKLAALA